MAAILNGNELYLSGFVGDNFWDDGFTTAEVVSALAALGPSDVTLRINSGGGIATEGAAIYAALKQHKGAVNVQVEGIAASAASLIAMAGATRVMTAGAVMMIHDPATVTFGDVTAHEQTIRALNALGDAYAGIYAEVAGISVEDARAMMRAETWMSGQDALDHGFATHTRALAPASLDTEPTAFAYGVYAKAPRTLVALATSRGWQPRALAAAPAALRQRKEPTMSTQADPAPQPEPETPVAPTPETPAPTADPVAAAAEVAAICAEGGIAFLASELISGKVTPDQARARAATAKDIRAAVDTARRANPTIKASVADDYIRANMSATDARAALLDQVVAKQSAEITSPHAPQTADATLSAKAGWDKAIAAQNARIG